MRHKHNNRILGRTANHRNQLLKTLTSSLLEHKSIVTTEAKAKELRRWIEPLITKARRDMDLHNRRLILRKLMHKTDFDALVEVAKNNQERPGGYLRLTRLPVNREDAASMMRIDIMNSKK